MTRPAFARPARLPRLATALLLAAAAARAAGPAATPAPAASHAATFAAVTPDRPLLFPRDHGAHPAWRTEWWYATGWLQTPDGKPLGFQVTFFRSATGHDPANPSAFAPKQLVIAHAALSDPAAGRLLHEQRSAREGFGLAWARTGDTDLKLDDWRMRRAADGSYQVTVRGAGMQFALRLAPTQPLLLQGQDGYSRKGAAPQHASYYYSQPQLRVVGSVTRAGQAVPVTGSAWLDHEWSSQVLAAGAAGWDWAGINLDDGGALMAFQIRARDGRKLWAQATLRDRAGRVTRYNPGQVGFSPRTLWRSPRTGASYPVATTITTGALRWQLAPLQPDQELDSRRSTGAVYWEGAVEAARDGRRQGRGYLELTGYVDPMTL